MLHFLFWVWVIWMALWFLSWAPSAIADALKPTPAEHARLEACALARRHAWESCAYFVRMRWLDVQCWFVRRSLK
jgi:hypothetical protein